MYIRCLDTGKEARLGDGAALLERGVGRVARATTAVERNHESPLEIATEGKCVLTVIVVR